MNVFWINLLKKREREREGEREGEKKRVNNFELVAEACPALCLEWR